MIPIYSDNRFVATSPPRFVFRTPSRTGSLDILNLLADSFELDLDGDDMVADFGILGLRTQGIRLAQHLLQEKVEPAADRLGRREPQIELIQVTFQPRE